MVGGHRGSRSRSFLALQGLPRRSYVLNSFDVNRVNLRKPPPCPESTSEFLHEYLFWLMLESPWILLKNDTFSTINCYKSYCLDRIVFVIYFLYGFEVALQLNRNASLSVSLCVFHNSSTFVLNDFINENTATISSELQQNWLWNNGNHR